MTLRAAVLAGTVVLVLLLAAALLTWGAGSRGAMATDEFRDLTLSVSGSNVECDVDVCNAYGDSTFQIGIDAKNVAERPGQERGYSAFEAAIKLRHRCPGGPAECERTIKNLPRSSCIDQIPWPDASDCADLSRRLDTPKFYAATAEGYPMPQSFFLGKIMELDVQCQEAGLHEVTYFDAIYFNDYLFDADLNITALISASSRFSGSMIIDCRALVSAVPRDEKVDAGGTAIIDVFASTVTPLAAYEFHLAFDPAVLEFVSVTLAGEALEDAGRQPFCLEPWAKDLANGIVSLSCSSTGGVTLGPSGNVLLATVSFEVKCLETSTDLEFVPVGLDDFVSAVSLSDNLGGSISTDSRDASLTVSPPGACSPPTAAPTATPTVPGLSTPTAPGAVISIDSLSLEVDETGSVTLKAVEFPEPGLGAWTFDVAFDPSVLRGVSCRANLGGVCNEVFTLSSARITGASATPLVGDLNFGSITFECVSQGVSALAIGIVVLEHRIGDQLQEAQSETENGQIVCSNDVPQPTLSVPATIVGDASCDGLVNPLDAALILQLTAGMIAALPCPGGGDTNGDGTTNPLDAALVLQFSAGLLDSLPP